jgi:lysosomal Pro-X carboxypeptidase
MYGTSFPSTNNCTLHWIQQRLDQFSSSTSETFLQRYYTYDLFWNKGVGPVFFYTGNEADVGLYVNNTGLMWQNAQSLGALLIFAEHRYYGLSQPSRAFPSPLAYLSHEQALADYAVLIDSVKTSFSAQNCPFITFGGSYGGMLAAWMRLKYPALVEGAISASAPLLAFAGEAPAWPSQSYYRVVTESAQYYSAACADNIRAAFPLLDSEGSSEAGRARLQAYFSLCTLPMNASAVEMLKYYVRDAFDELAMGNYPFASSYIGGTAEHPLPAYPLRQACGFLMDPGLSQSPATLFPALSLAVGVLYNASQSHSCFDLPNYPTPLAPQTPVVYFFRASKYE